MSKDSPLGSARKARSLLERDSNNGAVEYAELLRKIGRPDLLEPCSTDLLGYRDTIAQIETCISKSRNFYVSGPSGVGKTTLVREICSRKQPNFFFMYLDARWMTRKQFGDQEPQLDALFQEAVYKSPAILFLDQADYFSSKRRNQTDVEKRLLNKLTDLLESIREKRVLVIASAEQPKQLDPGITKFVRHEIAFPLPNRVDRICMIQQLFRKFSLAKKQIETIADATQCYLYKDLEDLVYESPKPNFESVKKALASFKPETIKDFTTPCPPLHWEDIGGVENVKRDLQRTVIKPLRDRKRFEHYCASRSRGAILYGPPGCSKTMLAQALATESGYNFISVKGPELFSKWVGDSEAAVRKLYKNAREIAPCIIFFDEIDGFATERTDSQGSSVGDKVVTQLLTEFNGPPDDVFTIAATNRPDRVDSALMRPGRLDSAIYIPLPSQGDRAEIFRVHTRKLPTKFDNLAEALLELARRTHGYSGAEIAKVCRVASEDAWDESEDFGYIEWRHFDTALQRVLPTTKPEYLQSYQRFYHRGLQTGQRASMAGGDPTRELTDRFNESLDLESR